MQQIAKMFATLGFNVDTTGLDTFKLKLRDVRGDMALLARNARVVQDSMNGVSKALKDVNSNLKIKRSDSKLSDTYKNLKNAIESVDKAFQSITKNQPNTTRALGKIHSGVIFGEKKWKAYADQVQRTRDQLRQINALLIQIRGNTPPRINVNGGRGGAGGGSGGNGNGGNGGRGNGGGSRTTILPFGGGSWMGGIAPFFRSIAPATAIGGGLAAAGYATKEVVKGGRDMQKMQNIMTSATDGQIEYANAMEYVRKESNRLGQSTLEMGMGFAKVLQSAQGKMGIEKTKRLFTGFGELMTVFGSSVEDQQGVYRALGQMLSKGKVEAEEVGQLAERGISREVIKKAAERRYGLKNAGDYEKYQKAGKVKIPEIADELAKVLSEMANRNGALAKSLDNSRVAQERFNNKLYELKLKILEGGLDTALKKLFDGLMEVATAAENAGTALAYTIEQFKVFKKWLDSVTDGNGSLSIIMTIIGVLLLRNAKLFLSLGRLLFTLGRATLSVRSIFAGLAAFFRSGFGRALAFLGSRLFWVITLITTLISVGSALNDKMAGKVTWIDVWIAKFDVLKSSMELMWLTFTNDALAAWEMIKNPIDAMRSKGAALNFKNYYGEGGSPIASRGVLMQQQNSFQSTPKAGSTLPDTIALPNSGISRTDSKSIVDAANEALKNGLQSMGATINVNLDGQNLLSKNVYLFGNKDQYDMNG